MKSVLITCEHSSNKIPRSHRHLFLQAQDILQSHRGWDFGAKEIANGLGRHFAVPVTHGTTSRLLIDLNRSSGNHGLLSSWTRQLDKIEQEFLLETYHSPHWENVFQQTQKLIKKNSSVLHIGVHSFTPVYNGKTRSTDIGILYDPSRPRERELALLWQKKLKKSCDYVIHRNRPYRGMGDGLISSLRQDFSHKKYAGIELEVNHRLMTDKKEILKISKLLNLTLQNATEKLDFK